jgi:hypothetical protein
MMTIGMRGSCVPESGCARVGQVTIGGKTELEELKVQKIDNIFLFL